MPESRQWPGTAKEIRLVDSEGGEGGGQLADAVAAQLVGGVDRQLGVPLADDFTLFAEGAGDHVDVGAAWRCSGRWFRRWSASRRPDGHGRRADEGLPTMASNLKIPAS